MTAWLVALVVAAVLLLGVFVTLVHRRSLRREARRVEALTAVAHRLETTLWSLEPAEPPQPPRAESAGRSSHPPLIEGRLEGRAALLDALREGVDRAQAEGSRLAAAVVQLERDATPDVSTDIGALAGVPVYAVGPRSLALVLPGFGRAGALGVLARIQAERASKGRAVELESGEDAVELAARLLAPASD